jgi:putative inorganic carbon (HCO3(-)) transporter
MRHLDCLELRLTAQRAPSLADRLNGLAFILLLVCIAVSPFPWGAILPGGNFTIEAFAFGIAALAFATRRDDDTLGRAAIPVIALVLIGLLGLLQLVPLSNGVLRTISPQSARIYDDANEVLKLHDHALARPRISIAPIETKRTILLTLAYAALFTSGILLARTRSRRRWLVAVLLLTSAGHVLFAISRTGTERMHGAYVNANHFAGYLEIALAFAFGAIWADILTARDRTADIRDRGDRLEARILSLLLHIAAWGVIAAGIALTRSRGGVLAAAVTLIVLLAMMISRRGAERAPIFAVIAIAIGIAFVALTTGRESMLRLLQSDSREITGGVRVMIWRGSIDAWRLFPNFGSGLGAFKEAFRRVQPAGVPELVEQAHNDFMQLMVTGGWIGGLAGAVAYGAVFVILFRGWAQQRHREESAFALAAFGAFLSLTLHGLVEFNMSLPATAATLAVMSGAGVAAARHRSQ